MNTIIDACVNGWDIPERVKRLSLNSYLYDSSDLDFLTLVVAVDQDEMIVGIAAWEQASATDTPDGHNGLLLHGLYVDPDSHHQGIGSQLVDAASEAALQEKMEGLLVKAQADAVGFFHTSRFEHLPVQNHERDYPHRYWRAV